MADLDFPSSRSAARDLTHAAPFSLGPLAVDPPSRRIRAGERDKTLEPRVMRVLVALGNAGGVVFSRDDLIERCWDGVIVGDDAINRVVSKLRRAFDDLSGGAVGLETITKVGYRLTVDGQPATAIPLGEAAASCASYEPAADTSGDSTAVRRGWSRRATAGALVAAGAAGAIGYAVLSRGRRHAPDPRAVELYRRGQAIQRAGVAEDLGEAIAAYKQAVAIDPDYATAWGALALSYRLPAMAKFTWSDPKEVRTLAQRALKLDPGNADARLALIQLYSPYRRWREQELQLNAVLTDNPDFALGHVVHTQLLIDVGRLDEAVTAAERAVGFDPTRHIAWFMLAAAYYFAGRQADMDMAIDNARSRWPDDARIYVMFFYFTLLSKRYDSAASYLRDTIHRPRLVRKEMVDAYVRQAESLATGQGLPAVRNFIANQPVSVQLQNILMAVAILAVLGMVNEAFNLLSASYFGGEVNGQRIAPPGPLDHRYGGALFVPAMAVLRGDPRYASLLERTGLEDYWRKSGTRPDFRRG